MMTFDEVDRIRILALRLQDRIATLEEVREFARLAHLAGLRDDVSVIQRVRLGGFKGLEDFVHRLDSPTADSVVRDLAFAATLVTHKWARPDAPGAEA